MGYFRSELLEKYTEIKKRLGEDEIKALELQSAFSEAVTEMLAYFSHFRFISPDHIERLTTDAEFASETLQMADYYGLPLLQKIIRILLYCGIRRGTIVDFEKIWPVITLLDDKYLQLKIKPILFYKFESRILAEKFNISLCRCFLERRRFNLHYT